MPPSDQPQGKSHSFQAPKGTRDLYPQDLLRRRYIEKMWRDTSIRHGFEEIDGPTFEHLDLYTVKSGDAIVSELFSFRREGGEKDYALRPEFTPTLARMYAAKAGSLPKPTKWFWQQNCFRAEKPQRGRLREFGQWNADFIGGETEAQAQARADADVLACCADFLQGVGLTQSDVRFFVNDRWYLTDLLKSLEVPEDRISDAFDVLDQAGKLDKTDALALAERTGVATTGFKNILSKPIIAPLSGHTDLRGFDAYFSQFAPLRRELEAIGIAGWVSVNIQIARGLAYYTGMVFEVHEAGGKERAIAGGGRYDNLIEMFGGPPTPAVGFGMGDVVLSLILQDRGLMPEGQALLDKLSEPPASLRPDIFVISNGQPESDAALRPLVAQLRRGSSSAQGGAGVPPAGPLHARHTYKATKNIGKLLQEASSVHARFAAIIENASEATLKDLATGEQQKHLLSELASRVATT